MVAHDRSTSKKVGDLFEKVRAKLKTDHRLEAETQALADADLSADQREHADDRRQLVLKAEGDARPDGDSGQDVHGERQIDERFEPLAREIAKASEEREAGLTCTQADPPSQQC